MKNVGWGGDKRKECCMNEDKNSIGDCDAFSWPKGPAFHEIIRFGMSNERFYTAYL